MSDAAHHPVEAWITTALQEGLGKSGVLWLGPSEQDARPAWFAYVDPHVFLVTGPGEQTLPDLTERTVLVLRAKDTRSRILVLPADVERLLPSDQRWPVATEALAKARLNAPALPAELPARWAADATVYALTPQPEHAHR